MRVEELFVRREDLCSRFVPPTMAPVFECEPYSGILLHPQGTCDKCSTYWNHLRRARLANQIPHSSLMLQEQYWASQARVEGRITRTAFDEGLHEGISVTRKQMTIEIQALKRQLNEVIEANEKLHKMGARPQLVEPDTEETPKSSSQSIHRAVDDDDPPRVNGNRSASPGVESEAGSLDVSIPVSRPHDAQEDPIISEQRSSWNPTPSIRDIKARLDELAISRAYSRTHGEPSTSSHQNHDQLPPSRPSTSASSRRERTRERDRPTPHHPTPLAERSPITPISAWQLATARRFTKGQLAKIYLLERQSPFWKNLVIGTQTKTRELRTDEMKFVLDLSNNRLDENVLKRIANNHSMPSLEP